MLFFFGFLIFSYSPEPLEHRFIIIGVIRYFIIARSAEIFCLHSFRTKKGLRAQNFVWQASNIRKAYFSCINKKTKKKKTERVGMKKWKTRWYL